MSTSLYEVCPSSSGTTGNNKEHSVSMSAPRKSSYILETLSSPNEPGIAQELSSLVNTLGISEEAAFGHETDGMYRRTQLLVAEPHLIDELQRQINARMSHIRSWLTAISEARVWTISTVCPFADDVILGTRQLITSAEIDIRFESSTKDHAPNMGTQLMHQYFVVQLPDHVLLSTLELLLIDFETTFGGATEMLPGVCLNVLASR